MHHILEKIVSYKRKEVITARSNVSESSLDCALQGDLPVLRSFKNALTAGTSPRLITEIKRKSPSAGLIREDFDPAAIAKIYETNGARALSILTDEHFFGGRLAYLTQVRRAVQLPLLRKEFIIDPYQIKEARIAGADAVLLIARILDDDLLSQCLQVAKSVGLDCLTEVHDDVDMQRTIAAGATIIGMNNRNLDTLEIDLAATERMIPLIPQGVVVVSESGIRTHADIVRLSAVGADAFLIGETLMKAPHIGVALTQLRGV